MSSYEVILHVSGEEPIVCEVDALPGVTDQIVIAHNPRRKDGKELHYVEDSVSTLMFPVWRINFIQVLPQAEIEDVIDFIRE